MNFEENELYTLFLWIFHDHLTNFAIEFPLPTSCIAMATRKHQEEIAETLYVQYRLSQVLSELHRKGERFNHFILFLLKHSSQTVETGIQVIRDAM